ncbi:MAG: DNA topoisomerase IB [Parachlamydia sp.]|nr:DNA topoisomerase IB [Parachlamydia sp.]
MKKANSKIKTALEPEKKTKDAGLVYVNDQKPGITRALKGAHFKYYGTDGKVITDTDEIQRIRSLAIPPAYKDVWICPKPNGHIQATGRDSKGRKQYRYHARWKEVRDETKYNKMVAFAQSLPSLRKRINRDMALPGLPKEKVLATVVHLLEVTLIRIGNEEYVRENNSYGLTTMRNHHVDVDGTKIMFNFRGKSGKKFSISLQDKRLAKIVKRCKELPGQDLFEYIDDEGNPVSISSTDVNEYLQNMTNDHFTAKDFRTWAGTVLAYFALQKFQQFDTDVEAKKNIVQAIENVAKKLGNTPSVCRKCYVHPEVFHAYLDGTLIKTIKQRAEQEIVASLEDLSSEESAVLAFLQQRLEQELKKNKKG